MLDRRGATSYKPEAFWGSALIKDAQVAQLVEQRTENPRVGGSNPPLGTIVFNGS